MQAMIVGFLSVVLGVLIGHSLAERSRLRDRLRIAYADFVSAVQALKLARLILEVDRAALKASSQGGTREGRNFFADRFGASSRLVLESGGNMSAARTIIDLVEVDREFRNRIVDIYEEVGLMPTVETQKQLEDVATRVDEKCDSLLGALHTKHPLLKLGRTA